MIKAVILDFPSLLVPDDAARFAAFIDHEKSTIHWETDVFDLPKRTQSFKTVYDLKISRSSQTANEPSGVRGTHVIAASEQLLEQPGLNLSAPGRKILAATSRSSLAVALMISAYLPPPAHDTLITSLGVVEGQAYAFTVHAGSVHFVDTQPHLFAEIIARLGVEPDETLIIGLSSRRHTAAESIGIHSIYATDVHSIADQLNQHLDPDKAPELPPHPLAPTMIEPQLYGNLGALYGLVEALPSHFWNQQPDPKEWSPQQVVCHLLDSERLVQRPRLQRILTEENPFLVAPSPPPGPSSMECDWSGTSLVGAFAYERERTIALLRHLDQDDWQRPARHSVFGPTTLIEMAHFTAQHDRLHLEQLCQTIGQCH